MNTLRQYTENSPQYLFYQEMHQKQSLDYVLQKKKQYSNLNNLSMNIHKSLSLMDTFVDPSDPDLDVPNSIHAYQTAERIRKKYPEDKQLQLVGLIHDLGKVLFNFGEENWSVVGDTFLLGCPFPESIVFYDTLKDNPDYNKYTDNGIYKENCGLNQLNISFGHDEYLYQVLSQNKDKHKLEPKYWDIIRYHSFYPWHTGNDYHQFMNENDMKILEDVLHFNQFDLYSKEDDTEINDNVKQYYNDLLDEYFPNTLQW